jgi:DNA-binding NarL/FixJ family response regulator
MVEKMFDMKLTNKNNAAGKPKRVFLADQFPIVRLAVAEWLNRTPDLVVCGAADNATTALNSIRRLKPDIVVTEIFGQQDCRFIQTLHRRHPHLPILVFSFRDEAWYAPRALEAGADGYLMKGASVDGLVNGIRRTLEGRMVLSPNMRYKLLVKCVRRGRASTLPRKIHPRHHASGPGRLMAHPVRNPLSEPSASRICLSESRNIT